MKLLHIFGEFNKELQKVRRGILPTMLCLNLLQAFRPYVYILFTAFVLDYYQTNVIGWSFPVLALVFVLANGLLLVITTCLLVVNDNDADLAGMQEKNNVSRALLDMNLGDYLSKEKQEAVALHRSNTQMQGGAFRDFIFEMDEALDDLLGILIGISILMYSLFSGNLSVVFSDSKSIFFLLAFLLLLAVCSCGVTRGKARINNRVRKLRDEYSQIDRKYESYKDLLTNYKNGMEIRLYGLDHVIHKDMETELLCEGRKIQNKISWYQALAEGLSILIFAGFSFLGYILILKAGLKNSISAGMIITCLGAFLNTTEAMQKLSVNLGEFYDLGERKHQYDRIVGKTKLQQEQNDKKHLPAKDAHSWELNNISFRYDKENEDGPSQISNLSLKFHSREKIAIVGENGSGKTTLIKLICGLLKPDEGEILIDGINISEIDPAEYDSLFAAVFQDFHIYALPIGENVASTETYDYRKVQNALDEVGFPQKYDLKTAVYKECFENGVELSGGEAQKLAIARALYQEEASLFILDEPTAAMDPKSEKHLYEDLSKMVGSKGAIYISHRLSSCMFCDRILVMEDGKIAEDGSHRDLMALKGQYRRLWDAQAKYFDSK